MPIQSRVGKLNEIKKTHINSIIHLFESGCWLGITCIHSQQIPPLKKCALIYFKLLCSDASGNKFPYEMKKKKQSTWILEFSELLDASGNKFPY
jgi:hypothetical protein